MLKIYKNTTCSETQNHTKLSFFFFFFQLMQNIIKRKCDHPYLLKPIPNKKFKFEIKHENG